MGPKPQGYIILRQEEPGEVIALTRRIFRMKLLGERKWARHDELKECFVHRIRSLRKALDSGTASWLNEATVAYPASYNSRKECTEVKGEAIPFENLKKVLPILFET